MDSPARVGQVLDGRYRLDRLLGEGGMGTVYRAYHLAMDRDVAVKVLRGNLARDPTAARRFALEAKATTKVESPNAVKVFDFGITAEGEYFMVMEYLDGRTAQRELDVDGPMTMARALHVACQALAALSAAHAVGVIHRDVKPENLLLLRVGDDPDACKVLDFGVAKLMASAAGDLESSALTKEGMVFGTPEFMSPEQACGQALDGRSDVYSLAATLFTLLTGRPLFRGNSAVEVLSQHVVAKPPRLTDQPGLHHLHALDQVLQRALAKRPNDRYRDAAELAQALAFLTPAAVAPGQGAPTVPTPILAPSRGATPDSPLGVLRAPEDHGEDAGLRAAPLAPAAGGFAPGQTGYLPRLAADPSTQALLRTVVAPRRRWLAVTLAAMLGGGGLLGAVLLRRAGPPEVRPSSSGPVRSLDGSPRHARDLPDAPDGRAGRELRDAAPPSEAGPVEPEGIADPATLPIATGKAAPEADHAGDPPQDRGRSRRLQQHLAAARSARAAHNVLRQLTQADLALQLAPRDLEAQFLAGDALVSSGDQERGCRYLTKARRLPAAAARAAAAGCQ